MLTSALLPAHLDTTSTTPLFPALPAAITVKLAPVLMYAQIARTITIFM